MPDTPLRGRRGRDRRIAERIATDFATRHAPPKPETETDFDIGAVDAEVAAPRRGEAAAPATEAAPTRPQPVRRATGPVTAPAATVRKGGGQRTPALSAPPPLLAATGTFTSLRER